MVMYLGIFLCVKYNIFIPMFKYLCLANDSVNYANPAWCLRTSCNAYIHITEFQ